MLRLVFDQAAYQDQDRADRPANAGGYELVEWDEWFKYVRQRASWRWWSNRTFPAVATAYHQLVRRPD